RWDKIANDMADEMDKAGAFKDNPEARARFIASVRLNKTIPAPTAPRYGGEVDAATADKLTGVSGHDPKYVYRLNYIDGKLEAIPSLGATTTSIVPNATGGVDQVKTNKVGTETGRVKDVTIPALTAKENEHQISMSQLDTATGQPVNTLQTVQSVTR